MSMASSKSTPLMSPTPTPARTSDRIHPRIPIPAAEETPPTPEPYTTSAATSITTNLSGNSSALILSNPDQMNGSDSDLLNSWTSIMVLSCALGASFIYMLQRGRHSTCHRALFAATIALCAIEVVISEQLSMTALMPMAVTLSGWAIRWGSMGIFTALVAQAIIDAGGLEKQTHLHKKRILDAIYLVLVVFALLLAALLSGITYIGMMLLAAIYVHAANHLLSKGVPESVLERSEVSIFVKLSSAFSVVCVLRTLAIIDNGNMTLQAAVQLPTGLLSVIIIWAMHFYIQIKPKESSNPAVKTMATMMNMSPEAAALVAEAVLIQMATSELTSKQQPPSILVKI